ncbi:MAG: CDGSH iron-sulfur domain-containing protein [Candidatus Omnitrophota bacterium]
MAKKKFTNAQNAPFVLTMKPGKYAWCSCGESKKQPFCDGTHEETGMYPVRVHITEEKQVAWCGCKSTQNPPYCDGTHKKFIQ